MARPQSAPPLVFVDTNVLIYCEDHSEPQKQALAEAWLDALWQRRVGRLSVQVLNEFYFNVTTKIKPPLPQGDARALIRRYVSGWNPWVVDAQTLETAWGVQARWGLSWWDCLIIAAAQQSACATVLSEDMGHIAEYGTVTVINPFKLTPDEFFSGQVPLGRRPQ